MILEMAFTVLRQKKVTIIPQISVIMLTYNREDLLCKMIESIQRQTFCDFELIIVDNGSTDKSGRIAETYQEQDRRIQVIHRQRGSISAGRNTGLDFASGQWVTFCDDDDEVTTDFLEFLYQLSMKYDADIAICGRNTKHFSEEFVLDAESAVEVCLNRKYYTVGLPGKLIRRSLLNHLRFSEHAVFDDIEFTPRLLSIANRVAYHGLAKYMVNRTSHNHSSWTQNYKLLDFNILSEYLRTYHERTLFLSEKFPDNVEKWAYYEFSFQISMIDKVITYEIADCQELLLYMRRNLIAHYEEFMNCKWIQDYERKWMDAYIKI